MNEWATLRATRQRALRVALLPCAGRGERSGAGGPKQYVAMHGCSVVHWALLPFDSLHRQGHIDGMTVVLSADDVAYEAAVPPELRARVHASRVGGPTRAASVLAGLQELHATRDIDVLLLPATTALGRLPPASFLAATTFEFRQKQRLDEAALKAQLTLAGY
ncbi:MAG: 2-C-methyl-D-erythritol 4-phosphate cytidylyltransferase, partial [Betaproteobacteria bacterium]